MVVGEFSEFYKVSLEVLESVLARKDARKSGRTFRDVEEGAERA